MFQNRIDLSRWVMHFVHDRNPENNPAYDINQGEEVPFFPFHEDLEKHRRFVDLWEMVDSDSVLEPDARAFSVLMKILEDGHIRSGWSFRNSRPTIYGPRSACCFTEMPLYALLHYAQKRTPDAVGPYAIGLLRDELFLAGGRPAIYGLSSQHREQDSASGPSSWLGWPRKLDDTCGIAEHEQYRYVAMNLRPERRIDWGHEREWRWADVADACSCPGLPIWLKDEPYQFSRVYIVVPTQEEAEEVLDKLKELYDAKYHNYDYGYDLDTLAATKVIALDEIAGHISREDFLTVRLDNVPSLAIKTFECPDVTQEFVEYVKKILDEAHEAAEIAAKDFIATAKKDSSGDVLGGCGYAHLVLYSPQTPLATALQQLGELTVIGGVGYRVSSFGYHSQGSQALSVDEAAVRGAMDVLEKYFPDVSFGVRSRWD